MTETTETTPIVSQINMKGGVGKTTLTVHLAGAFAARGARVLAVDLAPGGDLTGILDHGEHYTATEATSLYDALLDPERYRDGLADLIIQRDEFDLLPSNKRLDSENISRGLAESDHGRDAAALLLDSDVVGQYDIVLVDNEPRQSELSDSALVASDTVVIPIYAEALSFQGISRLQKQIARVGRLFDSVDVAAIVLNRIEDNDQSKTIVELVNDAFADQYEVFEIRKRVDLQRPIAQRQQSIFAADVNNDDMIPVLDDIANAVEATTDVSFGGTNDPKRRKRQ